VALAILLWLVIESHTSVVAHVARPVVEVTTGANDWHVTLHGAVAARK
jgi:hypothetical protein